MRRYLVLLFLLTTVTSTSSLNGQDLPSCGPPAGANDVVIDAAAGSFQGKVRFRLRDEATVRVKNMNRLIYTYQLTVDAKAVPEDGLALFLSSLPFSGNIVSPPDAKAGAAAASPAQAAQAAAGASGGAGAQTESAPGKRGKTRCELEDDNFSQLRGTIQKTSSDIENKNRDILTQVGGLTQAYNDKLGKIKIDQNTMKGVGVPCDRLRSRVQEFIALVTDLENNLPVASARDNVKSLKNLIAEQAAHLREYRKNSSPQCFSFVLFWLQTYEEQLTEAQATVDMVSKKIDEIETGRNSLITQREAVRDTLSRPDAFFMEQVVGPFDVPTNVTLKLEEKESAKADAKLATLVTRDLNFGGRARFAVSAGIAYSPLEDQTFKIVQSSMTQTASGSDSATSVKKVGYDKNSSSRTTPLVLIHTRLLSIGNSSVDLHVSFGLSAKIQDNSATAEYLAGFSLSLAEDRFFLTVGGYYGTVQKLGGGFSPGDPVPPDVTELPVTKDKHLKPGFALSYRIK